MKVYFVLFICFFGCSEAPKKIQNEDELIDLAYEKHGTGDFQESIALLDKAIKINPNNVLSYFNRAAAKTNVNDIDGAIDDCKSMVNLDNKNTLGYFNLGTHYDSKGGFANAIKAYNNAETANLSTRLKIVYTSEIGQLDNDPDYSVAISDIYYYRAMSEMQKGDIFEAMTDLLSCIENDYYLDYSFYRLGECYQRIGDKDKACEYFTLSKEKGSIEADSLFQLHCVPN